MSYLVSFSWALFDQLLQIIIGLVLLGFSFSPWLFRNNTMSTMSEFCKFIVLSDSFFCKSSVSGRTCEIMLPGSSRCPRRLRSEEGSCTDLSRCSNPPCEWSAWAALVSGRTCGYYHSCRSPTCWPRVWLQADARPHHNCRSPSACGPLHTDYNTTLSSGYIE